MKTLISGLSFFFFCFSQSAFANCWQISDNGSGITTECESSKAIIAINYAEANGISLPIFFVVGDGVYKAYKDGNYNISDFVRKL